VGPRRQWLGEKEKREGGEVGWHGRRVGPPGPKREPVRVLFFFLFQTSFSNHFSSQIQFKPFTSFSQEFYRPFRNHTSNQKPCKPTDDAHTLVVSKFIKLSLIFLEFNLNSNLISLNP
jgi:hypothetical protein